VGSKEDLLSTVGKWKTRQPAHSRIFNTDFSDKAQSKKGVTL